jgi:hypothetical protein
VALQSPQRQKRRGPRGATPANGSTTERPSEKMIAQVPGHPTRRSSPLGRGRPAPLKPTDSTRAAEDRWITTGYIARHAGLPPRRVRSLATRRKAEASPAFRSLPAPPVRSSQQRTLPRRERGFKAPPRDILRLFSGEAAAPRGPTPHTEKSLHPDTRNPSPGSTDLPPLPDRALGSVTSEEPLRAPPAAPELPDSLHHLAEPPPANQARPPPTRAVEVPFRSRLCVGGRIYGVAEPWVPGLRPPSPPLGVPPASRWR